jgi:cytochrome c-type biogenesis protein
MINFLTNLWISFAAGIVAPLAAVCVLPLYPGFLSYLASQLQGKSTKRSILSFVGIITAGIIISMMLFGLIFTKILQVSLTNAIEIISPIAFGILALVSLLLIFNFDLTKFLPQIHAPVKKNPYLSSFIFGFFFGAIVLPCNPASLIVLFALSTTTLSFIGNFLNFIVFGIGMAMPLIIFGIVSTAKSTQIISFLSKNKRKINIITGIIMLVISLYYLIFVFGIISF